MRDPGTFGADAECFRPERFLGAQEAWMRDFSLPFGFGRRICPGMHLARNSLFIVVARLLWAFDIRPAAGAALLPVGAPACPSGTDEGPAGVATCAIAGPANPDSPASPDAISNDARNPNPLFMPEPLLLSFLVVVTQRP